MKLSDDCSPFFFVGLIFLFSCFATLHASAGLESLPLIEPEEHEYAPGRSLYFYQPPDSGADASSRSALLFIHGGGWGAGNPDLVNEHCRYFASKGMVAIAVQYRLTNEPGVTVFECIADVKAALRWVRTHANKFGIDPNRIVAAGDSAGGHLAACAGVIDGLEADGQDLAISSQPNALILYYPILDTTPPYGWDLARYSGAPGRAVLPRAEEFSPNDHIAPGIPPTLIIHGTDDDLTPIAWSDRYTELMIEQGNRVELVKFEGQKHAFITPGYGEEQIIWSALEKSADFLKSLGFLPATAPAP